MMNTDLLSQFHDQPTPPQKPDAVRLNSTRYCHVSSSILTSILNPIMDLNFK